jgi:enoyl-CoA hydratase/carnithine racemase
MANALELVLTARVILAPEAAAIGLVNRVVPGESLLPEARAMAAMMAACKPQVLAAAKAALHFGAGATMAQAMHNEQDAGAALRKTLMSAAKDS